MQEARSEGFNDRWSILNRKQQVHDSSTELLTIFATSFRYANGGVMHAKWNKICARITNQQDPNWRGLG